MNRVAITELDGWFLRQEGDRYFYDRNGKNAGTAFSRKCLLDSGYKHYVILLDRKLKLEKLLK